MVFAKIDDPAKQTWQSFSKGLTDHGSLTSLSPRSFLDAGDAEGWGPFMMLHPSTAKRLQNYCGEAPPPELGDTNLLLKVRSLQFFANYKQARELLPTLINSSQRLWGLYCGSLDEYVHNTFGIHTRELIQEFHSIDHPRLQILASLQLSRMHLQIARNQNLARTWLETAKKSASLLSSEIDQKIANARIARYESELGPFDILGFLSKADLSTKDLTLKESLRRLCDFHVRKLLLSDSNPNAEKIAEIAYAMDPNCSRAAFLLGEARSKSQSFDLAVPYFVKASVTGFDERHLAEQRLTGAKVDVLTLKSDPNLGSSNPNDELACKINQSHLYQRLAAFWNSEVSPRENDPLFTYTPYLSLNAIKGELNPFYQTLTCQRVTSQRFREEMIHVLLPETDFKQRELPRALSIEFWSTLSPKNTRIYQDIVNSSSLDTVQKCLISRYLSALGFYNEALQLTNPELMDADKFDLTQAYEYSTYIFLKEIREKSSVDEILYQFKNQFPKIPVTDESLRIRITLAIFACVYFGNNNRPIECLEWRIKGQQLLKEIQESLNFSDFEKQLLTSRFYRACSYATFMSKDYITLKSDAEVIEQYARNLQPQTDRESILARENKYPMLETCSRIWQTLGDQDRAYHLMKEIAADVDPQDAKAWLQTGEVELAKGNAAAAMQAFLKAGELGLPMGRIAWYKCGRQYEQTGDLARAINCYIKSLRAWPLGVSPLKRIQAIAPKLGWNQLEQWAYNQSKRISS